MTATTHDFAASRAVLGFVETCAWVVLAIGLLLALIGFGTGGFMAQVASPFARVEPSIGMRLVATIPGLLTAFAALGAVVLVQLARATVETAAMTGELLAIARRRDGAGAPDRYTHSSPAPAPATPATTGAATLPQGEHAPAPPAAPKRILPENPDGWRQVEQIANDRGWKMSSGLGGVTFTNRETGSRFKVSSVAEALRALDGQP